MTTLLPALIFHVMQDVGTLAEHFFELTGQSLANSSWANRRQRLPWDVFDALLRRLLRPLAVPATHEDAPAPRLSAAKVLRVTTALCLAVQLGEDVLAADQITAMLDRGYALMRRYLKHPPRPRSCPRAVRQPVSGWPRLLTRVATTGPVEVTIV